ncbi:DUF397 domain-containing protein [Actinoallomurus spadix]|uniref:DUF397 domain-containing protein n=1 Tax=Actinoallomurus spadix TaxID=79912 RepID=UPI003872C894
MLDNLVRAQWRKSTYSSQGVDCVEVADNVSTQSENSLVCESQPPARSAIRPDTGTRQTPSQITP